MKLLKDTLTVDSDNVASFDIEDIDCNHGNCVISYDLLNLLLGSPKEITEILKQLFPLIQPQSLVDDETCNDSETKQVTCPKCGEVFDGELPRSVSGIEECTHCDHVFMVASEEVKP